MTYLLPDSYKDAHSRLHSILSEETDPKVVEELAGQLISALLGVELAVAKSGFQHGGDVGPGGRQGRRFRVECKAYRETTSLNERELLGEMDQAISRDEALEAWVLVATRGVPEQIRQSLTQHGERLGIPVVILSWSENHLSTLAALCSTNPSIVAALISPEAERFAKELAPIAGDTVQEITRDLQSWSLGFESLRTQSHERLKEIMFTPTTATAEIGQNVAIGAYSKKIKRLGVSSALDEWWSSSTACGSPAAVVGTEGVGKTWATLTWIYDRLDDHPVTFFVPSSAVAGLRSISETTLKDFIAGRLYELTSRRSTGFWRQRVERLLLGPGDEGPIFTIVFDGINQEASIPWLKLLKTFQTLTFAPYVRCIVTSRPLHLGRLSELRGLIQPAFRIELEGYDDSPGGEFDQMLALEGLVRNDLPPDLIELARNPRLFRLVVALRERLATAGHVTVHRLLWEYGKDSFGERAEYSFSEREWREYLHQLALALRNGTNRFSTGEISRALDRGDISEDQVFSRLSDIVDGRFTRTSQQGIEFIPEVVAHSLAIALMNELSPLAEDGSEAICEALDHWLDPISGLDQRAEILRAAATILIETKGVSGRGIAGPIVAAWLQTQNLPDFHRHEIVALAEEIVPPLLDAIELSQSHAMASARHWAIAALRGLPKAKEASLNQIVERSKEWLSVISRGVSTTEPANSDSEKYRRNRLIERIGVDESGPIQVLGFQLALVDTDDATLRSLVPQLLEGFPLEPVAPLIELAVVGDVVYRNGSCVDYFEWLVLLNERDPTETANALRKTAREIQQRNVEQGVHPGCSNKVARILLRMTGLEEDDLEANEIIASLDVMRTYEDDYLADPCESWTALERRHFELVLNDETKPLSQRLHRANRFLVYPNISISSHRISEIRLLAESVDVKALNSSSSHTREDHNFDGVAHVFARIVPDTFAAIERRWLHELRNSEPHQRYWRGGVAHHKLLICDEDGRQSAKQLRLCVAERKKIDETVCSSHLLMLEILAEGAFQQASAIIESGLDTLLIDFEYVLKDVTTEELDGLIESYGSGSDSQQHLLLSVVSLIHTAPSTKALDWIAEKIHSGCERQRNLAFRILSQRGCEKLESILRDDGWTWAGAETHWANHYGSHALIYGGHAIPFAELIPLLAPWKVLEAARVRALSSQEIDLAIAVFGNAIEVPDVPELDTGATLTVKRGEWANYPGFYSAEPREEDFGQDQSERFRNAFDSKAQTEIWNRALKTAQNRVDEARKNGAKLLLSDICVADIEFVWAQSPKMIEQWITGYENESANFRRKASLAGNVFLVICEFLLDRDPERGVQLWHTLCSALTVKYLGTGRVDELTHMVFRAKDSPAVQSLRDDLISLDRCATDQRLGEIAFAASFNGRRDWVESQITKDRASDFVWRRHRAIVLSGLLDSDDPLDLDLKWAEGPWLSSVSGLLNQANDRRRQRATSRYWLNQFFSTESDEQAYASWALFLKTCDLHCFSWLGLYKKKGLPWERERWAHVGVNQSQIKRNVEKYAEDLNKTFLGSRTANGIGPWMSLEA